MKPINFTPTFHLTRLNDDLIIITNIYTKPSQLEPLYVSRLIKLRTYEDITELCLELDDGFDTLQEGNEPFIQSKVYIKSTSNKTICKTLIAEPYIPIQLTKVKNPSIAFMELRKQVVDRIHEDFYQALSNIESPKTIPQTSYQNFNNNPQGSSLNKQSFLNSKYSYIAYSFAALAFCYMGLGIYEKKVALDNQVHSSLNLSMDAEQLTQSDDQAMDKMFKEIGIDRNSLSNDLSCFSE